MSDREFGGRYPSSAKRPPPERGIKMKKAGTTWWGQRWIAALESILRGDAGRLARGRTYARAGRTHDLVVERGKITAKVTGSRATPYAIGIELAQLDAAAWSKAIAGMAEKAQFAAELLAGQMPQEIDEVFRAAGTSLFPTRRADLVTRCSCPDWGDPCKHVAATHYVLGEALDRDPFLLFELRGRSKDDVLTALRRARGGDAAAPKPKRRGKGATVASEGDDRPAIPAVTLEALTPSTYDAPRRPLPALRFSFDAPVAHAAVLRQLGAPASWAGEVAPAELLGPTIRAAAERARRLALAETKAPPDEANADAGEGGLAKRRKAPGRKPASTRAKPSRST